MNQLMFTEGFISSNLPVSRHAKIGEVNTLLTKEGTIKIVIVTLCHPRNKPILCVIPAANQLIVSSPKLILIYRVIPAKILGRDHFDFNYFK